MIKKTWRTEWEIKVAIRLTEKKNVISAININNHRCIQCMTDIKTQGKRNEKLNDSYQTQKMNPERLIFFSQENSIYNTKISSIHHKYNVLNLDQNFQIRIFQVCINVGLRETNFFRSMH